MKKSLIILFTVATFITVACKKGALDLENPNEPGMESLEYEEGVVRLAAGVYNKFGLEYWWMAMTNHEIMGDAFVSQVGNYSWRWLNQPTSMTLKDGTVINPPAGLSQPEEMRNRNLRVFGNDNQFYNEWLSCYLVNNQANLILKIIDEDKVQFSGNAEEKKKFFKAWAYWWKGYIYSRIGSLYVAGIVTDVYDETNDDYKDHNAIIEQANLNFDKAIDELSTITASADYEATLGKLIPSFTNGIGKGGVLKPEEWIRTINTYKARNLLVNKYTSELTSAELNAIQTLATQGIKESDLIFTNRSALDNDLVSETAWQPFRVAKGVEWMHTSERLIQEFYPGDQRLTRNFQIPATGYHKLNPSGRGYQYSTRYNMILVEDGGDYASLEPGLAETPIACSYEENELMLAETKIRLNQIELGLAHVDKVRQYQNAGLPVLVGQGLNKDEAIEVVRRERRVALIFKNVAFYDARRFGYLKPVSKGGGRKDGTLFYQRSGQSPVLETGVIFDYNYIEWWDVPTNELDFNAPRAGSASVNTK